jgi:hypothetical protein
MEANDNLAPETPAQADIPSFEEGMMDTQSNTDNTFNDIMGLPNTEETAPPKHEDTQQLVEKEVIPQQDFSQNEVAPNENNEEVRYQYWQSQAAKLQNQVNEMKEYQPMVDYLRNNPQAVQNLTPGGQTPEASEAPTSQEQEQFPPPPARPEQPAGFSREEAFSDPASASGQYLDSVDKWRDDMQTYNQLAAQYEIATMRESYNEKIQNLEGIEAKRIQDAEQSQKMNEVRDYVSTNYDLGDKVDDFLTTMNDPSSVNMDDLVGYYKYKNGIANAGPAPVVNTGNQASATFNQLKRAQSVPTPMGVQPAQSNNPTEPSNDFMDSLIKNNKQNNIL